MASDEGLPSGLAHRAKPAPTREPLARAAGALPIYSFAGTAQSVAVASSRHSNVMLNEVYNSRILELAGNIPRLGRLANPDASATAHSKLCGSTVTVDLKMDGDTVTDFSHEVDRKSTRLNSSHLGISYAVFCLK